MMPAPFLRPQPRLYWFFVACFGSLSLPALTHGQSQTDDPSESKRPAFTAAQIEFFESQVRPILVERCHECHDPANGEPGGGLSLVSRADILAGGDSGPAIDVADPLNSLLVEAVRHGPRVQMPPDEKLPTTDVAILIQWIDQKAPWPAESDQRSHNTPVFDLQQRRQAHWAWQLPVRTPAPETKNQAWPTDPLDRFILQKLEAQGLRPAPAADGLTWLRRVYLDLIGLPPTPDEAKQFEVAWAQAMGNHAAENLAARGSESELGAESASLRELKQATVDRLLSRPAFGEHWARHWLDLVRYAETCGHEFDFPLPGAFEYRDYVIRSLNQDVPYHEWVMEHLAGDLLPQPRLNPQSGINESVLGTMFWYLSEANHAPVDVRGDQANRVDNQIDVFGKTFLGMTVACARCHDHKFDAISARDYYALFGIVKGARRDVAVIDTDRAHEHYVHQYSNLQAKAAELMEREWDQIEAWVADPETDFSALLEHYLSDLHSHEAGSVASVPQSHPLRFVDSYRRRPTGQSVADWWSGFRERALSQAEAAEKFQSEATLLVDFSDETRDDWWSSGWAFDEPHARWRPHYGTTGDQAAEPNQAAERHWVAATPGTPDSAIRATTLAGTLRSPTFRLLFDRIHIRARGEQAKIRLVVDGYQMNIHQDLLFSQTIVGVNSVDETWITMHGDLGKYIGHEVYLEVIDEGAGWISVSQIWQGGEQPALAPDPSIVEWCRAHETIDGVSPIIQQAKKVLRQTSDESRTSTAAPAEVRHWAYRWSRAVAASSKDLDLDFAADAWLQLHEQAAALTIPPVSDRKVYVATPSEGQDQELYIRGNAKNRGDVVPRGTLEALWPTEPDAKPWTPTSLKKAEPSGRLDFARSIASADNPLTARVMVNRIWLHLLGDGLVTTPDDFGFNGSPPSHPELLDHLALEFMDQGWSIKQMIRRIVLSQTYGQAANAEPQALEQDPGNRWCHSARVRRLSGEVLRDAMLQVSGRLDTQLFGPSVPAYVSDLMQGRGRPASGPLDGQGRRSIYLEIRRNFLHPWMLVFDTPAPFATMGRRSRSNVPAQALALLNDPLVNELAESWAKQVLSLPLDDRQRLELMYWSALTRPLTDREQTILNDFLQARAESTVDRTEIWTQVAHAIFNMKEFTFVD